MLHFLAADLKQANIMKAQHHHLHFLEGETDAQ